MANYYYVDEVTGDILIQNGSTQIDPAPSGMVEVNEDPSNIHMSWDLVHHAWYWKPASLRELARVLRDQDQSEATVTWKGYTRSLEFFSTTVWIQLFMSAFSELKTDQRAISMGSSEDAVIVATNAEIVDLSRLVIERIQRAYSSYNGVAVQINNAQITDEAGLITAWTTTTAVYTNTRTLIPTIESLVSSIATINATLSALPAVPKVYNGTTIRTVPVEYTNSATISGGTVVFQLTTTGLSSGTALFSNVDYMKAEVSDANAAYNYSYALTNGGKTLTVTVNKATSVLLGLIQFNSASNGSVVNIFVKGN